MVNVSLSPVTFDDFVGQQQAVRNVRVAVEAAKARNAMPRHMLFAGPPGLGKTTLSRIIGAEMGVDVVTVTGPSLQTPADLLRAVGSMRRSGVVFIDEIHRVPWGILESLYSVLDDGVIHITMPKMDPITRTLPDLTILGATTSPGSLPEPLRSRMEMVSLDLYDVEDLAAISQASAGRLGLQLSDDAAKEVASRSKGTPRAANKMLLRIRDSVWSQGVQGDVVGRDDVVKIASMYGIDRYGLDAESRRILVALRQQGGGPIGLSALAAAMGESANVVQSSFEPPLIALGLVGRTGKGRVLTEKGEELLSEVGE